MVMGNVWDSDHHRHNGTLPRWQYITSWSYHLLSAK